MDKIRVFISSVQKELENERHSIRRLLTLDASLGEYFTPILYELEPASSAKAIEQCVKLVGTCQQFILIVGRTAGFMVDDVSITHQEFNRAAELHARDKMKILVFIKAGKGKRDPGAEALVEAVRQSGVKYKEFADLDALDEAVQKALRQTLRDSFDDPALAATPSAARQALLEASDAENRPTKLDVDQLDMGVARTLVAAWDGLEPAGLKKPAVVQRLLDLGHLVQAGRGTVATLGGAVVLGSKPSSAPGLRSFHITAEAYAGREVSAKVIDQAVIEGAAPDLVQGALAFVARNTRHPTRVVGARRITLDEYPEEVLREAVVNAVAHRSYDDTGGRIVVRVFSDRVTVSSPGALPGSLTPQRLKSGKANPMARNPLIAQSLFHLHLMEHRGSGFQRIRSFVETSGLKDFDVALEDGFVVLTLFGPGEDIETIPLPPSVVQDLLPARKLDRLNDRQRDIAARLARGETLTSRECEALYGVTRDTTARDFAALVDAGVAARVGGGRSTHYVFVGFAGRQSSD